ncbi:MAG: hypothetical protein KDC98_18170 [Planctomycetes bacterium]|nr:hypothetical protein [Planctomycetota bacterium]
MLRTSTWTLSTATLLLAVCLVGGYFGGRALAPNEDPRAERIRQVDAELAADTRFAAEIERALQSLTQVEAPAITAPAALPGSSATAPATGDPEWATFERTDGYLPLMLQGGCRLLTARELFRNEHLNVVDAYIAPAHREAMAHCVEQYRAIDARLADIEADAIALEIDAAIDRGVGERFEGRVVPHAFMPAEFQKALAEQFAASGLADELPKTHTLFPKVEGQHHVTRYFGDHGIAVPVAAMPQTRAAREARMFVATELGGALLAYFTGLGLMSDDSALRAGGDLVESLAAVARGS